jgi:hypothetical protein
MWFYWVFGIYPSFDIKKLGITTFRILDLFTSSGEGETTNRLGLSYLRDYSYINIDFPVIELSSF